MSASHNFPEISKIVPEAPRDVPGAPKGPARHSTAAKRRFKDPRKSPKGPPNDTQRTRVDALRIHKVFRKANKNIFKTNNEAVTDFVYSSNLFKKVRKLYLDD